MDVDWSAILHQRCPRCRRGAVFGGVIHMHRRCSECDLAFEREPGYFLGAMYFSYGMGILAVAPLVLALMFWSGLPASSIGWLAGLELLLLSPWLFRYSRVAWMHFDQHFDPR